MFSLACINISARCFNIKRHTVSVCSSPPAQPHAVRLSSCKDEVVGQYEEVTQQHHIKSVANLNMTADIGTKGAANHIMIIHNGHYAFQLMMS